RQIDAWHEVFTDLPPEKLDHKLATWLWIGDLRMPRIQVSVRDSAITERRLGDADVLAARSLLDAIYQHREAARRDAEAALAIDRTNLLAGLIEAELTHTIAVDDARATAAANPDDWRAWRLVKLALKGEPDERDALTRMCALAGHEAPECT